MNIQVLFEQTLEDSLRLNRLVTLRSFIRPGWRPKDSAFRRGIWGTILLLAGILLMLVSGVYLALAASLAWGLFLIVPGFLLWGFVIAFTRNLTAGVRERWDTSRSKDPRITVELTDEAFRHQGDDTCYEVEWPAVVGVEQLPWCVLVRDNDDMVYSVSARAYADAAEMARFVEVIRSRIGRR
jgi:hypothetical protein